MSAQELEGHWLLNEDEALKNLLKGITVSDNRNPERRVGVWFGQPDVEITDQTYPYIIIDLIDVGEAPERAHRNKIDLWYRPDGAGAPQANRGYVTDYPIPYNLVYQITTYARHPRHDRQIIRSLMKRMGGRWHSLYIPADETVRTMYIAGHMKRDSTEDSRRLFSNAYTVVVFSELLASDIDYVQKVREVRATFTHVPFEIDMTP